MSSSDAHRAQMLRCLPPRQSQGLNRTGAISVTTSSAQPLQNSRQAQPLQRSGGYGMGIGTPARQEPPRDVQPLQRISADDRTVAPQMRSEPSRVQPIQRPSGQYSASTAPPGQYNVLASPQSRLEPPRPALQRPSGQIAEPSAIAQEQISERSSSALVPPASHPRLEPPRGFQPPQRPSSSGADERLATAAPQARLEPPRPQTVQRASAYGSTGTVQRETTGPLQREAGTLQRETTGTIHRETTGPSGGIQSRLEPPRQGLPSQRPVIGGGTDERASCLPSEGRQLSRPQQPLQRLSPLQEQRNRPVPAPPGSRASWPPMQKRPSPGRVEEVVMCDAGPISLDEFLDATNAVVPEVRQCAGDDMPMDGLLSTLRSVSSKVDIDEFPRGPIEKTDSDPKPEGPSDLVYSLVDVPEKEGTAWEYDLDRENSNAAALLLCHTSTPKLSLHPRGLRSVAGPVSFTTAAQAKKAEGVEGEQVSPKTNANEPAEEVSFTWKLLGAADKVVEFFTSLRPVEENRRLGPHPTRQTLPNPKRLQPNELFESRQQDQMKQAAQSLRDAVLKLIIASGTTNADTATLRLPAEIRSRFARLRLRLAETLNNGQQPASDAKTHALDLERFVSTCNWLAQSGVDDVDKDVRQEFISFSQRHAKDLESHCRTFKWMEEQRIRERGNGGGAVRGVSYAREPSGLGAARERPVYATPYGQAASGGAGLVRSIVPSRGAAPGLGAIRERCVNVR